MDVTFDKYSFKINGKREFILGGSIHYYRLPSHKLWEERLRLLKECGLNTIDIYFPWNYHSPQDGVYDFSGIRDVDYLLDLIEENNFYLVARPGPYICSEVDAGGFPGWLLKKGVVLRCQKKGKFFYDAEYLKYTREWYEQIVPKIAKRKNLILFQIENEYNFLLPKVGVISHLTNLIRSFDPKILLKIATTRLFKIVVLKIMPRLNKGNLQEIKNNQYFKELYNLSRELGIKVPIFHNDVFSLMGRVRDVDAIGIDDYSVQPWDKNWRTNNMTFAQIDVMEEGHNLHKVNCPIFIAEFQGGWFDMWGGFGYDKLREMFGTEQIDIATKSALSQGVSALNWFMFSGGTTWGYLGSPDVYTSYDFSAPISEMGEKTERYYTAKKLVNDILEFEDDFIKNDLEENITSSNKSLYFRARKSEHKKLVFLRNLTGKEQKTKLNIFPEEIKVQPAEMQVLVFDKENKLIKAFGESGDTPSVSVSMEKRTKEEIEIKDWTEKEASPQIYPDYDDSNWKVVENNEKMDIDSLNLHYGFIWYRTKFTGKINKIKIDARHLYSIYINGKLLTSFDNFHNVIGIGPDYSKVKMFNIPEGFLREENVVVVLVESLGHHKGCEEDATNPRGIIYIDIGCEVLWKYRGGLISGERGITPVVDFSEMGTSNSPRNISLPLSFNSAVNLYESYLSVQDESKSYALEIDAKDKANIYLNGYLIGRYWKDKGPQRMFYLPLGILKEGKNHLSIAVWRRGNKGELRSVKLIY